MVLINVSRRLFALFARGGVENHRRRQNLNRDRFHNQAADFNLAERYSAGPISHVSIHFSVTVCGSTGSSCEEPRRPKPRRRPASVWRTM
jgi:hypothetical protein